MRCPRCRQTELQSTRACAECGFDGEAGALARLAGLEFLLGELATWEHLRPGDREQLRVRYERERRAIEVELGLRQPPPTVDEAAEWWLERSRLAMVRRRLREWAYLGLVPRSVVAPRVTALDAEAEALALRLRDAPDVSNLELNTPVERLIVEHRLRDEVNALVAAGRLDPASAATLLTPLETAIADLEVALGLRAATPATPTHPPPAVTSDSRPPASVDDAPLARRSADAVPPREPWTWDRLWESLLSERTLQAILFLGVALLFAAAVSLVVWNWETFPPAVQVTFLGGFTALFYGLGWYVRERMALRGSGVALSAVASLLVPLDFYAFYLSGGFPAERWPEVWLGGSLVCFVAYLLTTYYVQADFFGYLVGLAAGSSVVAALNLAGVSSDVWPTAVAGVGLVLMLAAAPLRRPPRWRILAAPLERLALLGATTVFLLTLGNGFIRGDIPPGFYDALAVNAWLTGAVLALGAARLRLQSLVLAAALLYPIAAAVTQRAFFPPDSLAGYGLGWALVVPAYIAIAHWLSTRTNDVFRQAAARTIHTITLLLAALATLWSLGNVAVVALAHPLLAGSLLLLTRLRRRPALLWPAALLLLSGGGAWQIARGALPADLALPWTLLSLLFTLAARRLAQYARRYDRPLYGAAILAAAGAVIAPLVFNERGLLAYAAGNWMGLSLWLAGLAHGRNAPGLRQLLAGRTLRWLGGAVALHWAATLPLVPWLWLVWDNATAPVAPLPLVFAALGAVLLGATHWAGRFRWAYRRPWAWIAHLANVVALFSGLAGSEQPWLSLTLFTLAAFYFLAARLLHRPGWIHAGSSAFIVALLVTFEFNDVPDAVQFAAIAALPLLYVAGQALLTSQMPRGRALAAPLLLNAQLLTIILVFAGASTIPTYWDDPLLVAVAGGFLSLGLTALLFAWFNAGEAGAVFGPWLLMLAGGLVLKTYSSGTGRSTALAAFLVVGYVAVERLLHRWSLRPIDGLTAVARRAWRLYRRPLLSTAWTVAALVFVLALGRNVGLLGTPLARRWAILALTTLTLLFAVSARLYRQRRLAWIAALLSPFPWTLLLGEPLLLYPQRETLIYALGWVVLAYLLLAAGVALGSRLAQSWAHPPLTVAHLLVPLALLWVARDPATAVVIYPLAIIFYLIATALDRPLGRTERFLYPAAALVPLWAVYLLLWQRPAATLTEIGYLVGLFAVPALLLGHWVRRRETTYGPPFDVVVVGTLTMGLGLIFADTAGDVRPPALFLAYIAAVAALAAALFRRPPYLYVATTAVALALTLVFIHREAAFVEFGWLWVVLGGVYIALAAVLRREELVPYSRPLLYSGLLLPALGFLPALDTPEGALVGFGLGALVYAAAAVEWRFPPLMAPTALATAVAYGGGLLAADLAPGDRPLAAWPGIFLALLLAELLAWRWAGDEARSPSPRTPFPWGELFQWPLAIVQLGRNWWSLSWYGLAVAGAIITPLGRQDEPRLATVLLLGAALLGWLAYRYRLRGWLVAAGFWAQLAALAAIDWAGWTGTPAQVALAFTPVTLLTAVVTLELSRRGGRAAYWARPLLLLLAGDVAVTQLLSLLGGSGGGFVTVANAGVVAAAAALWALRPLAFAPPLLGTVALLQFLADGAVPAREWAVPLVVLGVLFGAGGEGLAWRRRESEGPQLWEPPLQIYGWLLTGAALLQATLLNWRAPELVVRAVLRLPITAADLDPVRTLVLVLAIAGLFFLGTAVRRRRRNLAYGALLLMLAAWSLWLLLLQGQRELQLYAVPAGAYLLIVSWLEWEAGRRDLARWVERAGLLLLFGSLFWQSFGPLGALYALALVVEGLLVVWWGSLRRLRRVLYSGVTAVVVALVGQLIEPLLALNTLALLLLGSVLVALGIILERRLDTIQLVSQELRARLEHWE